MTSKEQWKRIYGKPNAMETAKINRSTFIKTGVTAVSSFLFSSAISQTQQPEQPQPIKLEWVKEFVGVCHSKFDRAKEMLENDPQFLHVSFDWGGGDFESGIEAAGHVGNKEIATYLLSKGARYNIYLACMLGHLDVVKSHCSIA